MRAVDGADADTELVEVEPTGFREYRDEHLFGVTLDQKDATGEDQFSARRIEVIFVTPPVWPVYASGMRADYWDRARTDLQRLSRTYGARYLSFLTLPELTAQDFLDADHLNERGAVRFTRVLNTAIDRSESQVAR